MSIDAMKLALEALDGLSEPYDVLKAQHALRTAIEQAEKQEPVAWADMNVQGEDKGLSWTPGYFHTTPLYTTPPAAQRPFAGLTDEEIIDVIHPLVMADTPDEATDYEIAKAIEAKLKGKNT